MRILSHLVTSDGADISTARLCEAAAEVVAMTGAGIMLMSVDGPQGWACTTNDVSELVEQLQFDLGEGPCVEAHRTSRPVAEPDLADPAQPRWLAFTGAAVAAGVRAVFGFPLQVGAVRLGALNLYRDRPGRLDDDQYADALVMADIATHALLAMQASAPPGALAAELESGGNFQFVVHQATGMTSVQLDVSLGQALLRLRGHAFGHDRTLTEVAKDVVDRRLRLDPDPDPDPDTASDPT